MQDELQDENIGPVEAAFKDGIVNEIHELDSCDSVRLQLIWKEQFS